MSCQYIFILYYNNTMISQKYNDKTNSTGVFYWHCWVYCKKLEQLSTRAIENNLSEVSRWSFDNDTVPANGIVQGMSSRCPFVNSNLIGMRTWQCQQRDSAKQNHLLWRRGLLNRLGPVPLHSAQPSLPIILCLFMSAQLSGRTFHVCFSFELCTIFGCHPRLLSDGLF